MGVNKSSYSNTKRIEKEKQKALNTSIKEGSAAGVSSGMADVFIIPYALELGARSVHIGFLSSFSALSGQIAQFFGNKLMNKYNRKKVVLTFVFLQALMWLPIAGISFLFWKNILTGFIPYLLIILYSILAIAGGLAHPSWFSWMGDLVPENKRGKYFGKRNLIVGIISLFAAITAGYLLKNFRSQGLVLLGFSIIFFLAFIFRMVSHELFKKQYSPKYKIKKNSDFSLISFIKRYDNFGKFAVYQGFFNFAIMFASPFFAVYMYKELNFNDLTYSFVTVSYILFYLLFLPFIGKFSDKYGNLRLLYLANFCFILSPLLWIFIKSPVLLIFVPQLIAGLGNADLVISFSNFIYASSSPEHR